jgi:hypothetical protein
MNVNKKDYVLYILIRTDLPSMSSGRAMAQASHASNAFIKKFGKHKEVQSWQRQTNQGFGTAIVLAADLPTIVKTRLSLHSNIHGEVIDPDYVIPISSEVFPYIKPESLYMFEESDDGKRYFFHREEVTCAYIFGSKKDLTPILGNLPLHP